MFELTITPEWYEMAWAMGFTNCFHKNGIGSQFKFKFNMKWQKKRKFISTDAADDDEMHNEFDWYQLRRCSNCFFCPHTSIGDAVKCKWGACTQVVCSFISPHNFCATKCARVHWLRRMSKQNLTKKNRMERAHRLFLMRSVVPHFLVSYSPVVYVFRDSGDRPLSSNWILLIQRNRCSLSHIDTA